jgi:hypothetical protein
VEHSPLFAAWEGFYVIVGTSAAALTGLQFVVIVLGAEVNALRSEGLGAFATPTIVHFSGVLLISAILSAPWQHVTGAAIALGAAGIAGIVYTSLAMRQARRQKDYVPVLEDWLWHGLFPLVAYTALAIAALLMRRQPTPSLFTIGATAVFLMFIGIHNAWDAVIYIAFSRRTPTAPTETQDQGGSVVEDVGV